MKAKGSEPSAIRRVLVAGGLVLLIGFLCRAPWSTTLSIAPRAVVKEERAGGSIRAEIAAPPTAGERILIGYGDRGTPPRADLDRVAQLLDHALLVLKSAAERPLGGNEDWAACLRGVNGAKEVLVPAQHPIFGAQGRLVDRWGSPLFIHALGARRFELRSAGPDRTLWTEDDVERAAE